LIKSNQNRTEIYADLWFLDIVGW